MKERHDPDLSVTYLPVSELVHYERNSKLHPSEQVDQIAASIERFGDCDPIAIWHDPDGNAVIVEGHGRALALERLGVEEAPVICLDHLSDEERRAYSHVHNQTTLSSGLDPDVLETEMVELPAFDWEGFGFDLPDAEDVTPVVVTDPETPEPPPEPVTRRGDVWLLGRHRVMCGDSRNPDDVARLMDGHRADIHFGSPPYAMEVMDSVPHQDMGGGRAYNEYDEVFGGDYQELLNRTLGNALAYCDDAMFVLGITKNDKVPIIRMLHEFEGNFCDVLVWRKNDGMPSGLPSHRGLVKHPAEFVFCFNQTGSRAFTHPQWAIGMQTNVIEAPKQQQHEYSSIHHATFGIELPTKAIEAFTDDSVLDLFGGTGTTLMAAEQLGRTAYAMDIDPLYVDVIVERWETFTGQKAELDA